MKNGSLLAVLLISALFLILVTYSIVTHKEAGLQKACVWLPQRVATYREEACVGRPMHPIRWADEIAVIRVRPDLSADAFQQEALRNVVKDVNEQIGERVLDFALLPSKADQSDMEVIVFFNTPPGMNTPQEGGTTTHYFNENDRVTSAVVYIYNTPLVDELHAVLAHELGHVIGLAHDASSSSVMHMPPPIQWRFTDSDVKLIRSLRGDLLR